MIATIMKFPKREGTDLFDKFVKETPGVAAAYLLDGDNEGATFTVWESAAAREAYLATALRNEIDSSLPGFSRTVYQVRASK